MPPYLGGQAIALFVFVVNLLGLGIGPTAVALVTDWIFDGDPLALCYAIPMVVVPCVFVAVALIRAARLPFLETQPLSAT